MRLDVSAAHHEATQRISEIGTFVSAVFSGRLSNTNPQWERVDLRAIEIQGELAMQIVRRTGKETHTSNIAIDDVTAEVQRVLTQGYSNITVTTTSEIWQCRITRRREALVHVEAKTQAQRLEHNRTKQRMLMADDPFLKAVGIATPAGEIKPSKQDKFRQVDDFLRVFESTLDKAMASGHVHSPTKDKPLRIVDLGCGHAYLTFALQAWAQRVRDWPVDIVGIDLRESSVQRNNDLVRDLGIESMSFTTGDIASAQWSGENPDVVLALHACDTATDDALAWAVHHNAVIVLAAPCCHHDVQSQVNAAPQAWNLLTRHGILRERLLDLVTDALRAGIMRSRGYRTDVFEFVGGEHTPRNIMLRAVKTGLVDKDAQTEVDVLAELWGVNPALAKRLNEN
ncbi:MAG: SAM-dependent methyltransferase [Actinobacteria bacterium]|nr:SAM-dependent methyltransferase [Actinomycetota bacterium]